MRPVSIDIEELVLEGDAAQSWDADQLARATETELRGLFEHFGCPRELGQEYVMDSVASVFYVPEDAHGEQLPQQLARALYDMIQGLR